MMANLLPTVCVYAIASILKNFSVLLLYVLSLSLVQMCLLFLVNALNTYIKCALHSVLRRNDWPSFSPFYKCNLLEDSFTPEVFVPLTGRLSALFIFFIVVCEATGTAAIPGLLCQPRVIVMIVENQMECRLAGET
jgi:hypothetical protein